MLTILDKKSLFSKQNGKSAFKVVFTVKYFLQIHFKLLPHQVFEAQM
jgi:hypothetical protein